MTIVIYLSFLQLYSDLVVLVLRSYLLSVNYFLPPALRLPAVLPHVGFLFECYSSMRLPHMRPFQLDAQPMSSSIRRSGKSIN